MKVGRNDPCPCGSGKKYKRCCLAREATVALAYSSGDREDALERLGRFVEREEFEGERDDADREFWRALDDQAVDCDHPDLVDDSDGVFEDWFALDRTGEEGQAPIEVLLQRDGERLTTGAREYLTRLGRTELRFYEVAAATPDDRLELVDLWTGEHHVVQEPDAEDLEPGHLVAARLMAGAGGELVMEGSVLLYPPDVKDDVMAVLRKTHQRVVSHLPAGGEAVFFKSTAPVLHFFWLLRVGPAESSPCIEAVFDVVDAAQLEAALTSHPDLEKDDDGWYVWADPDSEGGEHLGTFSVGAGQLVFHADSEERAERGRRMIEGAAGAAIRYAGIHVEEIEGTDGDDDDASPLRPEVAPPGLAPGGPEAAAPRGGRRVPVDWDDLEMALTWQSDEHESYLDLRTGQVVTHASDEDGELSEEDLDAALAQGQLVHIERLPSWREHGWMTEFAASLGDFRLRGRLDRALHGRGAFRRFKDELDEHPDERERWFAFRDARVREAMLEWLADHEIEPTTAPPERAT